MGLARCIAPWVGPVNKPPGSASRVSFWVGSISKTWFDPLDVRGTSAGRGSTTYMCRWPKVIFIVRK
jgi:hypothetical protein